jgi:glutathione-regulated potassium-efflux system ancillary protein KefG
MRTLVLFAHPALEKSRAHRVLAREAAEVPGITFRDLYEAYPDFDVDVPAEQELLLAHDVVVWQFPFYWYSVPPLLKQWFDLVLEHGWAYGRDGTRLSGKRAIAAISVGGREQAYTAEGLNRHSVQQFLYPVEQTARLCRMTWLPPFLLMGAHRMDLDTIAAEGRRFRAFLEALRDDRVDLEALALHDRVPTPLAPVLTVAAT